MRQGSLSAAVLAALIGAAPHAAARPGARKPAAPKPAARTPDAEVMALVRRHLAALTARCEEPADCAVEATTVAFATNGVRRDWKPGEGAMWSDVLFTGFDGDIQLAPRPGLVVADGDVAWFQVPYTATLTPEPAPDQVSHFPERVGGIAVRQRDGWHVAAVAYTDLIPDRTLFTVKPHPDWFDLAKFSKLEVRGDQQLARDVAAWFGGGFAAHAGPTARLIASGSSQPELARGAAALKLVKSWDRLGIRPWQIEVRRVAGDKLAFVAASVLLSIK